jgi:hypothetical protein
MKILHLSLHKGCINDINYVFNKLNLDFESMFFFNETYTDWSPYYKMTSLQANIWWNKYKDYFNKFDCILTSDTAPLSRIFLQNNWTKKLIIWICNRFDYSVEGDNDYYNLIRDAFSKPNVEIIGYTAFENMYCQKVRSVDVGNKVITPCGNISHTYNNYIEKKHLNNLIIIPPYHNDTIMMNLSKILYDIGIPNYSGRYDGPMDLKNYKAMVHIPYAWSNLALFESLSLQIVIFIPSKTFIKKLAMQPNFWHQNRTFLFTNIEISEWYNEAHKDLLIYFDSWDNLKLKIDTLNYEEHKLKLIDFGEKHEINTLNKWREILNLT